VIAVDAISLLVAVDGEANVDAVEAQLNARGFTLGLDAPAPAVTIDAWLAAGAEGARDAWRDPSDHLLAGLDARLRDGRVLEVRPGPRRAVGPDLVALFVGMRGRFGAIARAHLRIHRVDAPRPDAAPFVWPRDPEVTPAEAQLLDALEAELRAF